MAISTTLEALEAFHRSVVGLRDSPDAAEPNFYSPLLRELFEAELQKLWQPQKRNEEDRQKLQSGRIVLNGERLQVNKDFQQDTLLVADEIDLNEIEAAKYVYESQDDPSVLGRSLLECSLIRFHQQRKFALDCLRLLMDLSATAHEAISDDSEEEQPDQNQEQIQQYVGEQICGPAAGSRLATRCLAAMAQIRGSLPKINDKLAGALLLQKGGAADMSEQIETMEFCRASMIQQHELLAVILCRAADRRQSNRDDFYNFLNTLQRLDRYDNLTAHLIPAIGAFVAANGSSETNVELATARETNEKVMSTLDSSTWPLSYLRAAIRVWWLAEYSGFYLDDPPESALPPNTNLEEEDRQRSKQFLDALKDGAFDYLLSVSDDVRSPDWHDPVRANMRNWFQRKSPALASDTVQFSEFFEQCLMTHFEVFVDAFISNLPDVLRKLRVEEDEQRQLSQQHEQDLDLERFLLIVAYAYESRPDAASNFWSDADSNLAGFMHWVSRRASTPLVAAFCEMLQSISNNDECATAAHEFLLDEGHHSSGKMGRSQSLTWQQIFRELDFFADKLKQKPTPANTAKHRSGKPTTDSLEAEPESAMMLQCYLRLVTKLVTESETARQYVLMNEYNPVKRLLEFASTPIPPLLRGTIFTTLAAIMTRKTLEESRGMWEFLESWVEGAYISAPGSQQRQTQQHIVSHVERTLDEISTGFDDPAAFTQLLNRLVCPGVDSGSLNDSLPFPENLGGSIRVPGVEIYVDYVLDTVFAKKLNNIQDVAQARVLRLRCLDFALTSLSTFNEDLIVLANETSLPIDAIIATTDLATYCKLHPFARVMEWMLNDRVMNSLFNTIAQEPVDVGSATPDSPLVLGILRAIEVICKVIDLQATYLDLVRPLVRVKTSARRQMVASAAFSSFDEGLATKINLVVNLGNLCGLGHHDLTLASLKLLEKMSSSNTITTAWSGNPQRNRRNKAIVAMEANGEHEVIARSLTADLSAPLDPGREANSPAYATKIYILDFLYQCLQSSPDQPTIVHLLLGFKCDTGSLSISSDGAFHGQTSLFHALLRLLLETPSGDENGMRHWLISLKSRSMSILHVLWSSPLSSALVIQELRENELLFHLLLRDQVIQADLPWEGENISSLNFLLTDGSEALLDYLTSRRMMFEYIAMELCMIAQGKMPGLKRRIFEALDGQITGEGDEILRSPSIFHLYDFLIPTDMWATSAPELQFYNDLDLTSCQDQDADFNTFYDLTKVRDILLLRRTDKAASTALASHQEVAAIDREEAIIEAYLTCANMQQKIATQGLKVLQQWAKLLLVMIESNDYKGSSQTSFFLQALQAILPTFESFASDRPSEAIEMGRLAKVLLFKLKEAVSGGSDNSGAIGHLVSDKLYQLFQICLQAISQCAGSPQLRAVYYELCYQYLIGVSDEGPLSSSRPQTMQSIHVGGERLINVICDDAYSGEPASQTSALILLNALVALDRLDGHAHVVEMLNRLNFVGILVDSLRSILREWQESYITGNTEVQNYHHARLALLLQLCQTRPGAKYVLHSNLFRAIETSGLFAADPELEAGVEKPSALAQHYDLLAQVVRIIGAAILSRGSHNVLQGRKFLADHRMLMSHILKRSAGIGGGAGDRDELAERVAELADAFVVIIHVTDFLEVDGVAPEQKQPTPGLFH